MKAAVLDETGQPLRLEDVDKPIPADGEVLVQNEASGVCHSDLHLADGDYPKMTDHRVRPTILGHEAVGRVVEKGPGVEGIGVGDRVGIGWLCSTCGSCDFCREGSDNVCPKGGITGVHIGGGYAEYFKARAAQVVRIPEGLDPVEAAPLFCAGVTVYNAVEKAAIQPGQRVGVFGIGGLGHLAVQLVKNAGAETFAVDIADDKLELARSLGADHAFSADEAPKKIQAIGGVHAAIVTGAAIPAYETAFHCLRRKGTLVVTGLPASPMSLLPVMIAGAEFHVVGTAVGSREQIRKTLEVAAAGKLRCRTETAKLGQINDIFDRLRSGTVTGRVVLTFQDPDL